MINPADLIDRCKESIIKSELQRNIHQQWLDYISEYDPDYSGEAGSKKHHELCIQRYDYVIECFNDIIEFLTED